MLSEPFASDPRLYGALLVVIALAVVAQKFLPWQTYSQIHRLKTVAFPLIERLRRSGGFRFSTLVPNGPLLVSRKGYHDDAEYLTTVDDSVRGVWATLVDAGASPHLICSVKQRPLPEGGTQLSSAHVVWLHNDGSQTEAYLFVGPNGGVDVYAHAETAVTDAEGHLSDPQTDGDPRGVVWDALADAYAVKEEAA